MNNQAQHFTNVVSQTSEKELTLHGIRMADKAMVVELCALNKSLAPEQLHVAPMHEASVCHSLLELSAEQRKNLTTPIWHSIAQSLTYFSSEDSGICLLRPEDIRINADFTKLYLTNWLFANSANEANNWVQKKADSSIEQMYLTQLSILYHYLLSGESLFAKLEDVEKDSWRDEHIKNAISSLNAESELKDNLLRAAQLNGGFYTDITIFSEGIKPFYFVMAPIGLAPFALSLWTASSVITSFTFMMMVFVYMHTL
jgi:hypothetical protein